VTDARSSVAENDRRIIDNTLAGHSDAFGEMVEKYQNRLYNSVARLCGTSEDARDVVQDAFVQAFLKLNTFRGTSNFYTWLYRIAFNTAMSHRRRNRPTSSLDEVHQYSGAEPVDQGARPDQSLEQQDRATQIHKALDALSKEHRTILILREVEDLSYEMIAEILALPVGTIRSRLHRARMRMKEETEQVMQQDRH
jgi:RNA polymerase sigma-70 factor (ECF subfamily)